MKVFFDDVRHVPDGWAKVSWPDEAVDLPAIGKTEVISLDNEPCHDNRGTGHDLVLSIATKQSPTVNIFSHA